MKKNLLLLSLLALALTACREDDPEPRITALQITAPDTTLYRGDSLRLRLTPTPPDADIRGAVWTSGDSLVAVSGVDAQDQALVPRVARKVAARTGRDVEWATHARLGATMRRVRYRFLPQVDGADLLFVCAGSNDLMARRSLEEWTEDLDAVLDGAVRRGRHVVACSAGQLYRSPALMATLRSVLREWTDIHSKNSTR